MSQAKRKAPFDIDQKKIDNGEYSDEDGNKQDLGKISTPQEIKERKILKIKGTKDQQQSSSHAEVKFSLTQNLQKVNENDEENKKTSLFDNSSQNKKDEDKNEDKKPIEISFEEKDKILDKFKQSSESVKPSGLFNNIQNSSNTGASYGGLFSNKSTGSSLFGNKNEQKTESISLFGGSGGLFSNNTATSSTGGLFSGIVNQDKKDTDGKSTSLFGNTISSGGLFGNLTAQKPGGLFGNTSQPSGGLFSMNQQSGGLLNIGTVSNNNDNEEDDDEDDDAKVSGQNSPEIDKSKTEKFSFENVMEKTIEKVIVKFKKNDGDIQEKGSVSIEKKKESDSSQSVFVYRNNLKQVVYQGNIIKQISKYRNLNNKEQNIFLSTIVKGTDDDGKEKLQQDQLKIQFSNDADGKEFKEQLAKILD